MKYLFLSFLVLLFGCTKTETTNTQETLPPITQVGANTAGCIIDGKVLVPKNGSQAIGGFPVYGFTYNLGYYYGNPSFNDYFALRITNRKDVNGDEIYLHLSDMTQGVGDYIIEQSNGQYYINSLHNNNIVVKRNFNTNYETTYLSNSNAGKITITRFDYPNKIISGIFSCSLYNKDNPTETIQITEGRFDVNLITLNQ